MIRLIITISIAAAVASCSPANKMTKNMEDQTKETTSAKADDATPKVTGVGGIFFFSDNPEATRKWYSENLGLETNDFGSSFESRDINKPDQVNILQWSPFKKGSSYFEPSKKEFMINYRVQHIEKLVDQLRENGTTILDSIASYDYGKFVHILDPEGNKIELWEPAKEN